MRPPTTVSRRTLFGALLAGAALPPARADAQTLDQPPAGVVEIHRLRVVNQKGGAIQASADRGATWTTVGRVTAPATLPTEGFVAAEYARPGEVAAVAVHGIRIRVSGDDRTLHAPLTLSLVPLEFGGPVNAGFGGHVPGFSGIRTDIPAGVGIFRDLAPYPGNPVLLESRGGRLSALPPDHKPSPGDILVLPVWRPANPLVRVVLENRVGGTVEGAFADGATRELARVVKPVQGVGRFDGTAYTGVGRLNTAHVGVVTVSTAPIDAALPEGQGKERRGGFQITPAWHNRRGQETGAPMMLELGAVGPDGKPMPPARLLEGVAPLFRDGVSIAGDTPVADCRIDDGDWEPLPSVTGARLDAFTADACNERWKAAGSARRAQRGVTAFRLRLPERGPDTSARAIAAEERACQQRRLAAARRDRTPIVKGQYTIKVKPTNPANVAYVRLSVDGAVKAFTNVAPFELEWDTTKVPDGEYVLQAEVLDATGAVLAISSQRVYVHNAPAGGDG